MKYVVVQVLALYGKLKLNQQTVSSVGAGVERIAVEFLSFASGTRGVWLAAKTLWSSRAVARGD